MKSSNQERRYLDAEYCAMSWDEFGRKLGLTLYGFTYDLHASFTCPGTRNLLEIDNVQRAVIEEKLRKC